MDILKKIGTALALVSSAFLTPSALAQITPESGWWYNPDESGRGYAIEVQDHQVFMAVYTYDNVETDGVRRPIWLFSGGVLVDDDVYEGTLNFLEDGQCLGCEYTAPVPNTSENKPVRIEFTSRTTAEITIDGETIEIERLHFAGSYADPNTRIMGEWHLIAENPNQFASQAYIGTLIILDDIEIIEGATYISGCRSENILNLGCTDSDDLVLGSYNEDLEGYVFVMDDEVSSNSWRSIFVTLDTNRLFGSMDIYSKTGGSFDFDDATPLRAYRSASKAFVQTGEGPAKPELFFEKNSFNGFEGVQKEQLPLTPEEKDLLKIKMEEQTKEAFMSLLIE